MVRYALSSSSGRAASAEVEPNDPSAPYADALECARSLALPIGWRTSPECYRIHEPERATCRKGVMARVEDAWVGAGRAPWGHKGLKLLGWLITAGALSFGAPFWFDLLNKIGNLRSTGAKPRPATETTASK